MPPLSRGSRHILKPVDLLQKDPRVFRSKRATTTMAAPQTFLRQRTAPGSPKKSEEKTAPDEVASRSTSRERDEVVWGKTPGGEGL